MLLTLEGCCCSMSLTHARKCPIWTFRLMVTQLSNFTRYFYSIVLLVTKSLNMTAIDNPYVRPQLKTSLNLIQILWWIHSMMVPQPYFKSGVGIWRLKCIVSFSTGSLLYSDSEKKKIYFGLFWPEHVLPFICSGLYGFWQTNNKTSYFLCDVNSDVLPYAVTLKMIW